MFGLVEAATFGPRWVKSAVIALLMTMIVVLLSGVSVEAQALVLAQVVDPRSTYDLWVAVLAILTMALSSLILSIPEHWGPWAKRAVVAGIAAVLSAAGLWYGGQLDTGDWGRTWLLVFLGATALYTLLWRPASDALKGQPQS